MLRRLMPALCLLVAYCGAPARSGREVAAKVAEKTTICEIVRDPGRFDGKRVTVSGCITTDGKEYIALSDIGGKCTGGLVPVESTRLPASKHYEVRADERVCGVFTGTFRRATVVYDRVLEVEDTSNLRTAPIVGR
jgi:hypothetical protein